MNHLTDDAIDVLSELVVNDMGLGEEEISQMHHIAECEECYNKLKAYMAVTAALNHLEAFGSSMYAEAAETKEVTQIQIVISPALIILEQLVADASERTFEQSLQMTGARGQKNQANLKKLENIDEPMTFVAFNPSTNELTVQIDGSHRSSAPQAYLEYSDGSRQPLCFERYDELYIARVREMKDGEYKLILE